MSTDRNGDLERGLAPRVRVVSGLGSLVRPVTLVLLFGEHDYATRAMIEDALAPLDGQLVVDLTWCRFIDSSIIALLIAKHTALQQEGFDLEVVLPPTQQHLSHAFDQLGVRTLLTVRDAPADSRRASDEA